MKSYREKFRKRCLFTLFTIISQLFQRTRPRHDVVFRELYLRNDCIDLHVRYTAGKLIERSNWMQVYFAQRRNEHPASASNCDDVPLVVHLIATFLTFCGAVTAQV